MFGVIQSSFCVLGLADRYQPVLDGAFLMCKN